jgi:hypothetical protein
MRPVGRHLVPHLTVFYHPLGGHGETYVVQPDNLTERVYSVTLTRLPKTVDHSISFRKTINLSLDSVCDIWRSWLSQANYVMEKWGLTAGEFSGLIFLRFTEDLILSDNCCMRFTKSAAPVSNRAHSRYYRGDFAIVNMGRPG